MPHSATPTGAEEPAESFVIASSTLGVLIGQVHGLLVWSRLDPFGLNRRIHTWTEDEAWQLYEALYFARPSLLPITAHLEVVDTHPREIQVSELAQLGLEEYVAPYAMPSDRASRTGIRKRIMDYGCPPGPTEQRIIDLQALIEATERMPEAVPEPGVFPHCEDPDPATQALYNDCMDELDEHIAGLAELLLDDPDGVVNHLNDKHRINLYDQAPFNLR